MRLKMPIKGDPKKERSFFLLTYYDQVYPDLLRSEPVRALADVDAGVLFDGLLDLEGLLGGLEPDPRIALEKRAEFEAKCTFKALFNHLYLYVFLVFPPSDHKLASGYRTYQPHVVSSTRHSGQLFALDGGRTWNSIFWHKLVQVCGAGAFFVSCFMAVILHDKRVCLSKLSKSALSKVFIDKKSLSPSC